MSTSKLSHLAALGVFGFDAVEPIVLAALITEDPLLLIGNSGTGKTFLLNSLSEALGLEHRHYNASLIAFDDLVGFPYPDAERGSVKFLETPATVWGAESVLIDEISRCKPEHQNRLFSLVHERRIQGIALPKLRFRWAAMNPCSTDQNGAEDYAGSEALDPALADRFALFVRASDWGDLTPSERMKVAAPAGEGRIADDKGLLRAQIHAWRKRFVIEVEACPDQILVYATTAVSALNSAGIRISPRRSRLMARSFLAASIAAGKPADRLFRRMLDASLPHTCWGATPPGAAVAAAHRAAWDVSNATAHRWLHAFMAEGSLSNKLCILLEHCDSPDSGSQAVSQLLATESPDRAAAFAFSVYPAAAMGRLPIGAEGVNDLGKLASPMLAVNGQVTWSERLNEKSSQHPEIARYAQVLAQLEGGRLERASQLFNAFLLKKIIPADPAALEAGASACVELLKDRGLA